MDLKKVGCVNGNWIHAITIVLDIDVGARLQTPKFLDVWSAFIFR